MSDFHLTIEGVELNVLGSFISPDTETGTKAEFDTEHVYIGSSACVMDILSDETLQKIEDHGRKLGYAEINREYHNCLKCED